MIIVLGRNKFEKAVANTIKDVLVANEDAVKKLYEATDLSKTVNTLREQIACLHADKSRITEQHERREREIEHKLGLERQRQNQELKNGLREQAVTLKEKALEADKQRFADQMKFHEERFTTEVGYLKDMIDNVLKRLPTQHTEVLVEKKVK